MQSLQNECNTIRQYLREHSLTNTWLVHELRRYGFTIGPGRLCDVLRLKNGGTENERRVIEAAKKVLAVYHVRYVCSLEVSNDGS